MDPVHGGGVLGAGAGRTPPRSTRDRGITCSCTTRSPSASCRRSRRPGRAPGAGPGGAISTCRGRTRRVWEFFEPLVNRYDAAVFTMEAFAQPGVSHPRLAFVPPSIDPTSEKNRPVDPRLVKKLLRRHHVDPQRPLVVQVSRFDPWKDPLGVIDAFRLAREHVPGLQLVMAGSMAADDPEGMEYLTLTRLHAGPDPDIHLLTDAEGVLAPEVNALQQGGGRGHPEVHARGVRPGGRGGHVEAPSGDRRQRGRHHAAARGRRDRLPRGLARGVRRSDGGAPARPIPPHADGEGGEGAGPRALPQPPRGAGLPRALHNDRRARTPGTAGTSGTAG